MLRCYSAGATYGTAEQEIHQEPLDEARVEVPSTGSTQTLVRISCGAWGAGAELGHGLNHMLRVR